MLRDEVFVLQLIPILTQAPHQEAFTKVILKLDAIDVTSLEVSAVVCARQALRPEWTVLSIE